MEKNLTCNKMKFYLLVDKQCCSEYLEKHEYQCCKPVWENDEGTCIVFECGSEKMVEEMGMPNMKKHLLTKEAFEALKESNKAKRGVSKREKINIF